MDKTVDVDGKTDNGFFDPEGRGVLANNVQHIVIAIERRISWSLFDVNILVSEPIAQLKSQLEQTLNVARDNQAWLYKNKLVNDLDTLSMLDVKPHEVIVCVRKDVPLEGPRRWWNRAALSNNNVTATN